MYNSDSDGLSPDDVNDFFNSETTESLLLGLIQLIKVDLSDYSISSTDFNLVFGFTFSELTVSSIIGSYLVKKRTWTTSFILWGKLIIKMLEWLNV